MQPQPEGQEDGHLAAGQRGVRAALAAAARDPGAGASLGVSDSDPEIARLYALPLAEFTPARNALAARLRKSGQQDQAEVVKALKKPTPPVWAINQVARQEPAAVRELVGSRGPAPLHAGTPTF